MKKELLNGKIFIFDNSEFQESIGEDDIREARVSFDKFDGNSWANGFRIWFNGMLIHSSKTFPSMEKRLNKLIKDWSLKQVEILED